MLLPLSLTAMISSRTSTLLARSAHPIATACLVMASLVAMPHAMAQKIAQKTTPLGPTIGGASALVRRAYGACCAARHGVPERG